MGMLYIVMLERGLVGVFGELDLAENKRDEVAEFGSTCIYEVDGVVWSEEGGYDYRKIA